MEQPSALVCPKCGAAVKEGERFCVVCGQALANALVRQPEPQHTRQQPAAPQTQAAPVARMAAASRRKSKVPLILVFGCGAIAVAALIVVLFGTSVLGLPIKTDGGDNDGVAAIDGGGFVSDNATEQPANADNGDTDGIAAIDGDSVVPGAAAGQPANADGSINLTVNPGEASCFAVTTGDSGFIAVNLPEGAFGASTQLSVSRVEAKLDGVVFPGFTVTDISNPAAHIALSDLATITFYSVDILPRDVMIVKYSDDMTSYEAVPSIGIETDQDYLIIAEVDGFSSYGVGKAKPGGGSSSGWRESDGLVWRIEAENHVTRLKTEGAESCDMTFFLRADSKRVPVTGSIVIPRSYTGIFDINTFTLSEPKMEIEGMEASLPVIAHMSDKNMKLTMMPKMRALNREEMEAYARKSAQWQEKKIDAQEKVAREQSPQWMAEIYPEWLAAWIRANPPPDFPKEMFDGYIGWGTARLTFVEFITMVEGTPDFTVDVPVIVRVRGAEATVSFTYPGLGAIELKGTFKGVGVTEAAAPPNLHDPSMEYDPGKPFVQPPTPEGDPVAEAEEANAVGEAEIRLDNGRWIKIIQLFEDDVGGEEQLGNIVTLWNEYLSIDTSSD